MKRDIATLQKNSIKLIEYSEPTTGYSDTIFLQSGCVGFYVTMEELKDIKTVIDYYLNIDQYKSMQLTVDGENVAI